MQLIDSIIFQFMIFSFVGWVLEVTYRSLANKKLINPGFNRGPYIPLYGAASLIIIATNCYISDYNILVRSLAYLTITTGMEYLTGEIMLLIFRKRYWDCSDSAVNIRGHVCPSFSIAWVAVCFVFEIFLMPGSVLIISMIDPYHITMTNIIFLLLLTADFTYSSGLPLRAVEIGRRYVPVITEKIEELPAEMGTLLFSSPKLRMARRQFLTIINEDRLRQVEKEILRCGERARRTGSDIYRKVKEKKT